MTHFALLCMWVAAIGGWSGTFYCYNCGTTGKTPDTNVIIRLMIMSIVALAFGSVIYSLIQATVFSGRRLY